MRISFNSHIHFNFFLQPLLFMYYTTIPIHKIHDAIVHKQKQPLQQFPSKKHSLNLVVFLAKIQCVYKCVSVCRSMNENRRREKKCSIWLRPKKNHKNKSVWMSAHKNGNPFFSIFIFFIYFYVTIFTTNAYSRIWEGPSHILNVFSFQWMKNKSKKEVNASRHFESVLCAKGIGNSRLSLLRT